MRIYSMTATFGKLEHATLELDSGFQVIHAPNEWGKSTWCAFLVAMFYGLETRAKTTKTVLADKEHYAPWSGSPMSGRIDLNWKGRDITIERTTKGRIPMGKFRAYETETGLTVEELDGTNCGQVLLGVERSVFLRSAFVRLSDLPVTQDEALRRRLNALVSTGDESSAGDRLAKGLKDLKNKCRYHKTGLIPQAEAERTALEEKIDEIQQLESHRERLKVRLEEISEWLIQMENHKTALAYAAAEADARHVAQARQLRDEAEERLRVMDAACAQLPGREEVQWALEELQQLEQAVQALETERRMISQEILWPAQPHFLGEETPDTIVEKVRLDAQQYEKFHRHNPVLLILGILLALGGGAAALWYPLPGWIAAGVGLVLTVATLMVNGSRKKRARELSDFYGSGDAAHWVAEAEAYRKAVDVARMLTDRQQESQADLDGRMAKLNDKIHRMTQGKGLAYCRADWENMLAAWDALADAGRELERAEQQLQTLRAMARTAQPPKLPDTLTYTEQETQRLLADGYAERRQLENRQGQYLGRLETLGEKSELQKQLDVVNRKLQKLEETYAALTIAQDTLAQATAELQRRFAPRIAKRARELMARMTGGRYDRMQLAEDFSLLAGAGEENTLQSVLWRSDGTVDQLYLALRLAVAEELVPDAPLILDDALVRFDDKRLKAALEILREESDRKQVILFSCQEREKSVLNQR